MKDTDKEIQDELTEDQRQLLMLSFEESFDEKNLISHEDIKKEYAQWLNK